MKSCCLCIDGVRSYGSQGWVPYELSEGEPVFAMITIYFQRKNFRASNSSACCTASELTGVQADIFSLVHQVPPRAGRANRRPASWLEQTPLLITLLFVAVSSNHAVWRGYEMELESFRDLVGTLYRKTEEERCLKRRTPST